MKNRNIPRYAFLTLLLLMVTVVSSARNKYLFVYFTGNEPQQEQIRYAVSDDGFHYTPLNGGDPVVASDSIALTGCVRDPHILRTQDGEYLMVATDMRSSLGWSSNRGIVLMKSRDLIHWQHHTVHFPKRYEGKNFAHVTRVWAPQTIYDEQAGKYMVYFSLLTDDGSIPYDRVYWAYANADFTDLEGDPQVLFDFHAPAIDTDIVRDHTGLYHLFFKTEQEGAHKGIRQYVFQDLHAPQEWTLLDGFCEQTKDNVEGAGVFPLIGGDWCLMYDCYTKGHYQFTRSSDLRTFTHVTDTKTEGTFTPRHGTVIQISSQECRKLEQSLAKRRAKMMQNTFVAGDGTFLLHGEPFVVKAAEIHYPRIPRPYWEHRIQMCKALGMNTICIYIFWNIHEQQEGVFDFTGQNDVAEFCRLAQKNGMYVIVRPGPYVCAEWEMGGLPWWLLKKKDVRLREPDEFFMAAVDRFEQKVAEQLAPLTIQQGGPIIMVQVENEYGSYGENKQYIAQIRDTLRKYWDKDGSKPTTLFQCDWNSNFEKNGLDDLVWTMNFGTGANIDDQFRRLRQLRPHTPLMCSEFWSGWFDKWGARHETRPAQDMVNGIDEMLSKGISFSLYMTHGGTSFGHWAGANSPGFAPDVTSYDYDAPINEYGCATEKYHLLRQTLQKYSSQKLPALPAAPARLISIPRMTLSLVSSLCMGVDSVAASREPITFEEMNMGYGSMIYRTDLPQIATGSTLHIDGHDFVQAFINGKYVGKVDRVKNERTLQLPPTRQGDRLTLLVEAMGRINFGRAIKDFKGLIGDVSLTADVDGDEVTWTLKDWQMARIKDSYSHALRALSAPQTDMGPLVDLPKPIGYYRTTFRLKQTGDTFLNMETWGKGLVYLNGHALGRFWSIGPQQTLYCPGCWLKKGENEIIVIDVVGPREPVLWGQDKPELDKLQLERSLRHNNIGDKPDLNSATPVAQGATKAGNGWQTITFSQTAQGRFLAIQCSTTHDGKPVAVAEIYLKDKNGKRIPRDQWSVKYANSENLQGNHTGDKAFDLQESTFWQTEQDASAPHLLVIDLGGEYTVTALEYLPRMEHGAPGSIKDYQIFILK